MFRFCKKKKSIIFQLCKIELCDRCEEIIHNYKNLFIKKMEIYDLIVWQFKILVLYL